VSAKVPFPIPQTARERGAALLAVLWIVALLIGLVAGVSLLLLQDMEYTAVKSQAFRARMLGEMGLAIAMNPDIKPDDPLLRHQLSDDERVEVEYTGEDGFLNPNMLLQREDRQTLRRIFAYWGMDLRDADFLIDAMLDWVDQDNFKRVNGAESKAYGRNDMPFNRPFRSVEEMSLVRGMELVEQGYPQWRSWFSVYAAGALDVNEARPEIISAVTGADIRLCTQLRATRMGRDGIPNTKDDAKFPDVPSAITALQVAPGQPGYWEQILSVNSNTRRILVKVQVGDFHREVAAVVQGSAQQGGTQIMWMGEK